MLGIRTISHSSYWENSLSSLATCLLTEVISEKAAVRAQLALFVDVTRAGRGIARFDVGAAELPYLTNEA